MNDAGAVALVVGIVLLVVGILLLISPADRQPNFCPECGGDLVTWTAERHENGYDWTLRMVGCPKVRDMGAGSPKADIWYRHYSRVAGGKRRAKFTKPA